MTLRRRTFLGLLLATLAAGDVWAQDAPAPAATPPEPPPAEPSPPAQAEPAPGASIDASWAVGGPDLCARTWSRLPDGIVGGPRSAW